MNVTYNTRKGVSERELHTTWQVEPFSETPFLVLYAPVRIATDFGRLSKYQYKGQHADHDCCRAKRNACFVVATAPKVERDKETDRWCKPQQLGEQVEQKTHNAILACAKGLCTEQEERARK